MNKPSQGMVLFTTLVMLAWITLMVLAQMRAVLLLRQVNQQLLSQHHFVDELERAAQSIAHHATSTALSACLRSLCRMTQGARAYTYHVIDYGVFPCLIIGVGEEKVASHHWMIQVTDASQATPALRLRIALREKGIWSCDLSKSVAISEGVISWHYDR